MSIQRIDFTTSRNITTGQQQSGPMIKRRSKSNIIIIIIIIIIIFTIIILISGFLFLCSSIPLHAVKFFESSPKV